MNNYSYFPENTAPERLKKFAVQQFGQLKTFAEKFGKSPQSLSKYLGSGEGKSIFTSEENLLKLRELGLNTIWYLEGTGDMLLKKNTSNAVILDNSISPEEWTREIPFITVRANAGEGFTYDDMEVAYIKESIGKFSSTCKTLKINGDSMLPIKSGSIITFDESLSPNPGDMCVALVDGVLYFKIFEIIDGVKYLTSSNATYEAIKLNGFRNWKILGKVIGYSEK